MARHGFGILLLVVAGSLLAPSTSARGAGWWKYTWKHRRAVTIPKTKPSRLDGDDVAVVTMPTGGKTALDARDVRVITSGRKEVACRILMVGPGDQIRVAFAIRPTVTKYYVYCDNPKAPERKKNLEIRRGVLLSTWKYAGGGTGNLAQISKVFKQAKELTGRDFRDRIFLGHNPFGPRQRIASTFVGYLMCPQPGRYVFCTSSRNSSFLLINDELVVDNHGWHGPQRDIRMRGTIDLKAGLHKLTFYHVSGSGDPIAVAAWRPPGQKRVQVIPPAAFAPVVRARPGTLEELNKVSVDFLPVHAGETFMKNRYYQRYTFKARANQPRRVKELHWDFGDGQTSNERDVSHVYLRAGMYTVTLTGTTTAGTIKRRNRIRVSRPWDRVIQQRLDKVRKHAHIVNDYDFTKLEPFALAEAVYLFQRTGYRDALLSAGQAFVDRSKAPGRTAASALPIYADALVATGRPGHAAKALVKGAKMSEDPAAATLLLTRAGQIVLTHTTDDKLAETLFQRVISQYGSVTAAQAMRDARIGLGDVWRIRGDYTKAREAYEIAGTRSSRRAGGIVLARGDLARHVEDYVRSRNLSAASEKLDEWADRFPTDKLAGYWSFLRVKMLMERKDYPAVIKEATVLARVNPTSHYVPQLLMLAAKAHRQAGQGQQAVAALKRLIAEYPESSLAAEAAKAIEGN